MNLLTSSKKKLINALKNGSIQVCVIGLGRIGLPTAAVFAVAGVPVIGVDIDEEVIKNVNSGKTQYDDEPGLSDLLKNIVSSGRLKATKDVGSAVSKSSFVIISVPTPIDCNNVPDYSLIVKVCKEIKNSLKKGTVVIVESTVGPGTVEELIVPLLEESGLKAGKDFGIASCPERANPGQILESLRTVPRIIGGIDERSAEVATTLYAFALDVNIVKLRDPKTANAVKLTENIFRDVNIALMNELAVLYEKLGIDIIEVINACATKWNFMPHYPGPGVGGPCLPANPYYLIYEGIKVGYILYLIRMAREVNDRMSDHVISMVSTAINDVNKNVKGSKISILGVAYKANIHDIQMTPMKRVYNGLKSMGAKISIYDPLFKGEKIFSSKAEKSLEEAITASDCILIGTDHEEFRNLDLEEIRKILNMPAAIVDTRNILNPKKVKEHGFSHRGIGRRL